MSAEDLERRVAKLEDSHDSLEAAISGLNTTIALLNQTVDGMIKTEEKRREVMDRGLLFFIGALISSFVAWIVRGGLSH